MIEKKQSAIKTFFKHYPSYTVNYHNLHI